jgi:hypothetical protein
MNVQYNVYILKQTNVQNMKSIIIVIIIIIIITINGLEFVINDVKCSSK